MDVLYFAYGSCMSPEDLARDVSGFEVVGPALVRGFRLGFTRYSRARRGGVADLVPDMAGVVEGVLYRVPVEQLAALDEREGAPDNYRRDFIAVRTPDGRIYDGVLTYVVADKAPEEIPPHPDYAATIMRGASAMLSPHYVEKLRRHIEQLTERKSGPRPDDDRPRGRRARDERGRRKPKVITIRVGRHARGRAARRAAASIGPWSFRRG
ncbi:MAG: gamma-glutamylcyclotransferase family protein [Limnochordales bacterium]|mgnify:FL=1